MRNYFKRTLSSLLVITMLLAPTGVTAAEIPNPAVQTDTEPISTTSGMRPAYGQPSINGNYYETHPAYMFGDNMDNFRPSAPITRAEAAALLARTELLNFESGITRLPPGMSSFNTFADVNPGDWFFHYIAWAHNAGLIHGHDGSFRPNAPITREEFAAILARTTTLRTADIPFGDADSISNWALAYVHTAFLADWVRGDHGGNFRPQDNITRAEVATSMNRMLGRINCFTTLNAVDVQNPDDARQFYDMNDSVWYFPAVLCATNDHYLTRNTHGIITWLQFAK